MALKIVKFRQVGNSSSQDFWVNFVYFLPNFAGIWLKIDEICLSLENSWLDELHEPHCNKLGLKYHKIWASLVLRPRFCDILRRVCIFYRKKFSFFLHQCFSPIFCFLTNFFAFLHQKMCFFNTIV